MKKSIRNLIIGAAMAISTIAASSAALASYVQQDMNFRAGASASAAIIGSVPAGAQVEVLGSKDGWDIVKYNGTIGYIHGGNTAETFVAKKTQAAAPTAQQTQKTYPTTQSYFDNNWTQTAQNMNTANGTWKKVVVSEGYLALRNAPSYDGSNVIGQLYTGDTVQITGTGSNGSYVQVFSPKLGCTGWVNAGFLA